MSKQPLPANRPLYRLRSCRCQPARGAGLSEFPRVCRAAAPRFSIAHRMRHPRVPLCSPSKVVRALWSSRMRELPSPPLRVSHRCPAGQRLRHAGVGEELLLCGRPWLQRLLRVLLLLLRVGSTLKPGTPLQPAAAVPHRLSPHSSMQFNCKSRSVAEHFVRLWPLCRKRTSAGACKYHKPRVLTPVLCWPSLRHPAFLPEQQQPRELCRAAACTASTATSAAPASWLDPRCRVDLSKLTGWHRNGAQAVVKLSELSSCWCPEHPPCAERPRLMLACLLD